MALVRHFQTRNFYTIQELYEIIKNYKFSAGVPEMGRHILYDVIVFPKIDDFNQIWIGSSGMGVNGRHNKWYVLKASHEGNIGSFVKYDIISDVAPITTGILSFVGSKPRDAYVLVDRVLVEIQSLNL